MRIKALLLAAGYGTRLRPLTNVTPKCLVQVNGKPLLSYWLKKLENLGCEEVIVNTHYLSHEVIRYLDTYKSNKLVVIISHEEEILGTAEVKDIFKSPKFGQIVGSMVIEGTIKRNKPIRVLRDNIVIFEGELDSLKRFKDDANEVPMGTECGIGVANYRDVKVGDKIEVFDRIEVKRTLD